MADMSGMAHAHSHDAVTRDRLGKITFPTSCAAKSQAPMARGVALLHSFGYAKAQTQFEAIVQSDPTCAMAHWGIAMTQYREIWDQPDADALKRGRDEMAQARTLSAKATPREKAYIDALSAFFDPVDADFAQRATAYEVKMNSLHAKYPTDVEAAAFDALAILADTPPDDASLDHAHRALAILKPLFKTHPNHPGLAHYIIHTCDTPSLARDGLAAARVYAKIAPDSPHALHMPSHIFARLGLWREDIATNLASAAASRHAEAAHESGAAHQLHADEFLVYAYLQTGQVKKAEALTASMAATGAHMLAMPGMDDMKDEGHFVDNELRVFTAMETHQWRKLAALTPADGSQGFETMDVQWGHAVAAGHLGDARLAAEALEQFDAGVEALKASPYAGFVPFELIRRDEMLGWQAYAAGRPEEAVVALRRAADAQDQLGQGEVDIPAREMLADVLLLTHRPAEALTGYRKALKLSPNRLNGLRGAATAAKQSGRAAEARAFLWTARAQTRKPS